MANRRRRLHLLTLKGITMTPCKLANDRLRQLIALRRDHGINYAAAVEPWLGPLAADFWNLPA